MFVCKFNLSTSASYDSQSVYFEKFRLFDKKMADLRKKHVTHRRKRKKVVPLGKFLKQIRAGHLKKH